MCKLIILLDHSHRGDYGLDLSLFPLVWPGFTSTLTPFPIVSTICKMLFSRLLNPPSSSSSSLSGRISSMHSMVPVITVVLISEGLNGSIDGNDVDSKTACGIAAINFNELNAVPEISAKRHASGNANHIFSFFSRRTRICSTA